MGSSLKEVAAIFLAQMLPEPPIPEVFASRIKAVSPKVFSTQPLQRPLYDIETFVSDAISGKTPESMMLGFDGHGINSWAVHYYLICADLALFLQLPWGGAYVDTGSAQADIKSAFSTVQLMLAREHHAAAKTSNRPRLVVVQSAFTMARWGWVNNGSNGPIDWQFDRDSALNAAFDSFKLI
jgi:hypothetical protein